MARREPKVTDIKRLFALSGNRCAFPKCETPIFLDGTLVGKVCHISGANPGSARYDAAQSDEERNCFANLIVMCGVHHDVIDDDEGSYTVGRLKQLKAEHEAGCEPLSEPEATNITNVYIQTLSVVTETKASRSDREIQAIERIWNTMVKLRSEFADVIFINTIMIPSELENFFGGSNSHPVFDSIAHYNDYEAVLRKFNAAGVEIAQRERPFLDQRLYSLFSAQLGILARAGMLLHLSFRARKYKDWHNDDLIAGHISSALPSSTLETLKATNAYSLQNIANEIDSLFNRLAQG